MVTENFPPEPTTFLNSLQSVVFTTLVSLEPSKAYWAHFRREKYIFRELTRNFRE